MRPSSISLKHVPLIKFIGGRHPRPTIAHIDSAVKAHPLSNGIIPGGQGTLKLSSLAASKPQKPTQSKSSSSSGSSKPYDYVSINELPTRFKNRPMDDAEIENVNTGGANLLF